MHCKWRATTRESIAVKAARAIEVVHGERVASERELEPTGLVLSVRENRETVVFKILQEPVHRALSPGPGRAGKHKRL